MNLTASRPKIILTALVMVAAALAVYLGVRGVLDAARPDLADEAARKKALEEAMAKGGLELSKADYWRPAPAATAETAGTAP